MSTPESVMAQMQKLLDDANTKTGYQDTDLTEAVAHLIEGYGKAEICMHTATKLANYVNNDYDNVHHFQVICADCGAVVFAEETGDHVDEDADGLCDLCGGCLHDMVTQFVSCGDGTHKEKEVCSKCGYTKSWDDVLTCSDEDGDGKCDMCGADVEPACEHWDSNYSYEDNGNGTHKKTTTCALCGEVMSEINEDCTDADGDGLCDRCGAAVETVCTHTSIETTWTPTGKETHITKVACRTCGEIISETTESCIDTDGNGKCDVCGGDVVCKHVVKSTTRTNNGNGTHTETTTCQYCGEILSENIVACTDEHGDGKCDLCGAEIPVDTTVWSYAAGELSGKQEYRIKVGTANALVWESRSGYVGVGATDGETAAEMPTFVVYAVPIPPLATRFTLTLEDSKVTKVTALMFKGTVSGVSDSSELTGTLTNGVFSKTFEAGAWDYVLFNFTREFTNYYVNQSTLVFA